MVRAVEKRSEWDTTIRSNADKWARIVLVLQAEFDIDDDWLHIIIGEAQFDMEADGGCKRESNGGDPFDRYRIIGDERQGSTDGEYHIGNIGAVRTRGCWGTEEFPGDAGFDDFGEDTAIPSAE